MIANGNRNRRKMGTRPILEPNRNRKKKKLV